MTLVTAVALCLVGVRPARTGARGARPELHIIDVVPGLALAFKVEPLGHAVRARCLLAVDRQFDLFDRLHARQRRAAPDQLLCLLCRRARQHDRDRFRQEPVHAVPVLRGADDLDLSARDAQGRRGGDARPAASIFCFCSAPRWCCSCRRSSPPGCSPARSISRRAASWRARPSAGRDRPCCWRSTSSASARRR